MRDQEHRYEVYELKDGFKVRPIENRRPIVYCRVDKQGFWSFKMGRKQLQWFVDTVPLFKVYTLIEETVSLLYQTWNPPERKAKNNAIKEQIIIRYCMTSTQKTLAKVIRDEWLKQIERLTKKDPTMVELHRKLYAVSNGSGKWYRLRKILEERDKYKYLLKDLLNYKAARIAVLHGIHMEFYPTRRANIYYYGSHDSYEDMVLETNWMKAFAYDTADEVKEEIVADIYTSLRKTLMNLPEGIPFQELFNLVGVRLEEPVYTRMKLWMYCYVSSVYLPYMRTEPDRREKLFHIVLKSTEEDIRNAIRYIWKYFPTPSTGDFRKRKGIDHAFNIIFDYGGDLGNWDIMGLTKRSEIWHHNAVLREEQEAERRRLEMEEMERRSKERYKKLEERNKLMEKALTAQPPIPLPDNEHITFLDSYQEIKDEGKLMSHCIGSYAENAVEGYCYLFHVSYKGEMASVEVMPWGIVRQSYGPNDKENRASEYGKKILSQWGKDLYEDSKPVVRTKIEFETSYYDPARDNRYHRGRAINIGRELADAVDINVMDDNFAELPF